MDYVNQIIHQLQDINDPTTVYLIAAVAVVVGGFFVKSLINYAMIIGIGFIMYVGYMQYSGKPIQLPDLNKLLPHSSGEVAGESGKSAEELIKEAL